MVGLAISPKARGDEAKIATALHKVEMEDPTFHLHADPQTKEMVAYGMSELHLQLLRERLKRRDKAEVETKEPKIPYRETDAGQRRGQLPAQEAIRRAGAVRRGPHPHVSAAQRTPSPRSSAPRTASPR